MMYLLGLITGAAGMLAITILRERRGMEHLHAAYVQEWRRVNSLPERPIVRACPRHRRAERYKVVPPLPLDIAGQQLQVAGKSRMVRIGGEWR